MSVSLIVPFYRNVDMLRRQRAEWAGYPSEFKIIVVDDGSPEPAAPIVAGSRAELYRINEDIPWNRNGARNLGAHVAKTEWIVQVDIDHLLPAKCAARLVEHMALLHDKNFWARFPRFRRGMADETRNKDSLPRSATYGAIKPHCDSYVMRRSQYWRSGGYDERYSGCLGGGGVFLMRMQRMAGVPALMPKDTFLEVFTRSEVKDASDFSLSRNTAEYTRRKKLYQNVAPIEPLNFTWQKVQ